MDSYVYYVLSEIARNGLLAESELSNKLGKQILEKIDRSVLNPSKLYAALSLELLANSKTDLAIEMLNKSGEFGSCKVFTDYVYDVSMSSNISSLKSVSELYLERTDLDQETRALINIIHSGL